MKSCSSANINQCSWNRQILINVKGMSSELESFILSFGSIATDHMDNGTTNIVVSVAIQTTSSENLISDFEFKTSNICNNSVADSGCGEGATKTSRRTWAGRCD